MTDAIELNYAMRKAGFTKTKLAEALGISLQALYNKINGIREFKASEIMKICDLLNLDQKSKEVIFFASRVE